MNEEKIKDEYWDEFENLSDIDKEILLAKRIHRFSFEDMKKAQETLTRVLLNFEVGRK